MNLVKSAVVGILFVLGFALVCPVVMIAALMLLPPKGGGASVGWEPVSVMRSPLAWTILAAVFVIGFVWEYRRLAH